MSFVPGAASTAVRDLLGAPVDAPLRAVVRHVGRTRVGLQVGDRLLVLDHATGPGTLPCTLTAPRLEPALVGAPGAVVRVDVEGVHGAQQDVVVARWWAPPRVHPRTGEGFRTPPGAPRGSEPFTSAETVLDDGVREALTAAAAALVDGEADRAADALTSVLGRGAGSTPDADDAVAGLLLAARHDLPHRTAAVEHAARTVAAAARSRTTALSAELLRLAAEGLAAAAVVDAVVDPTPAHRDALLTLGASSGASTAAGVDLLRAHLAATTAGRAA